MREPQQEMQPGRAKDRYDQLQPGSLEAALRSLTRRFRAALSHLPLDPAERERLLTLSEPGRDVLEALSSVVPVLAAAEDNLRRVLNRDDARLVDPLQPAIIPWTGVDSEARRIGNAAERLADLVAGVPARDWMRTASTDGAPVTALDIAREAVRRSIEALRRVEAALGAQPAGDD